MLATLRLMNEVIQSTLSPQTAERQGWGNSGRKAFLAGKR